MVFKMKTNKLYSQRLVFTVAMTCLATVFGAAYGAYELRGHSDLTADLIKISGLIALAAVSVSFVIWTVTHFKKDSVRRGGLAGLLTGLAIVPVPYFTAAFKAEVSRHYNLENKGLLMSALEAIPLSVLRGLETFLIISKVSIVAVIGSLILGVIIAKTIPPRLDEI